LLWKVKSTKTFVHEGKNRGVVFVNVLRPVFSVVPMVEGRTGHQTFEPTETPAHIRVDDKAPYGAGKHVEQRQYIHCDPGRLRQAQHINGDQAAEASEDNIQRVRAGVY